MYLGIMQHREFGFKYGNTHREFPNAEERQSYDHISSTMKRLAMLRQGCLLYCRKSVAYCKTAVTPLLTQLSYCSLALSHWNEHWSPEVWKTFRKSFTEAHIRCHFQVYAPQGICVDFHSSFTEVCTEVSTGSKQWSGMDQSKIIT